ncbi:MAG: protein kinase [Gemmatimonadales bacterium]|nr:protein kinase [Gemmatimonadales bacterium]
MSIDRLTAALADRYRIERELGQGGMATVYLAHDLKHDRQVAIKVLRPELGAAIGADRFLAEIRTTAHLQHPHILAVFDSGDADGLLWYAMPFVAGETLRARLEREVQLPAGDAVRIARDVAGALGYAHGEGVVHRDVKPENILLTSGHALVADFGIARATDATSQRLTETGIAVGTPAYMSPEQAMGERVTDHRADIYALGCVIYEMLVGEPPFTGPTPHAILARALTQPVPSVHASRDTIPAAVDDVVGRACARAPADRFATALECVAAFEAALAVTSVSAGRQTSSRRTARLAAMLGAAAAVGVVGVLAWPDADASGVPGSVAVMYLENLSADTLDRYLADGLTEEITSRLASVGALQVKSRTAMRRYRDSTVDPVALGRSLDVRHLLEGSVRRSGTLVKVTVRLVNTSDGNQVWSEEYPRGLTDLLALQEEIASRVATTVAGRLDPAVRAALGRQPTDDPVAYDHYLRGSFQLAQRTAQGVEQAITSYESAAARDPQFAAPMARVAYAYAVALDWSWRLGGLLPEAMIARGLSAAERALAADSTSSDAWMARGYLLSFRHPRTFEGVIPAFERSVAFDPRNAEALHQMGWMRLQLGDGEGAEANFRAALAVDPERAITLEHLSRSARVQRRPDSARRWIDRALQVDPGFAFGFIMRSFIRHEQGDIAGARADADIALRLPFGFQVAAEAARVATDAAAGDTIAARTRIRRVDAGFDDAARREVAVVWFLATGYLAVGDTDRALALIEGARPVGAHLWFDLQMPSFDPIRRNVRFQRVVAAARPPGVPTGAYEPASRASTRKPSTGLVAAHASATRDGRQLALLLAATGDSPR